MSFRLKKEQERIQRIANLAARVEPIIEGRTNALELSLRQIANELEQSGVKAHPNQVAEALRELGWETEDGVHWVKGL